MEKKYIKIISLIIFLIVFDQLIKFLVTLNFNLGEEFVIINNFLKFIYIKNTGAAFGMFSGNTFMLILIAIVLIWYLIKEIKTNLNNKLSIISFSLVLGGALGNLIDRVFRGYVVDYISFTLFNSEMAIFNMADIYITFGVLLLLYIVIRDGRNEKNRNN
jgi:signal peptidase II